MTIVYREAQGTPLTWTQLDGNFADLAARTNLSWAQIGGEPTIREASPNAPQQQLFRGDIYAWAYPAGQLSEAYTTFDVPFDWASGTDLVIGIHWSPGNVPATGNVRFGLEFTYAGSYGPDGASNIFGPTNTVYINASQASGTPYMSYLNFNEPANNFPASAVQQNMRFLVRIFRDGANVGDTFPESVFIIGTDFFYQTNRFGTSTKAPPFV